MEVYRDKMNRTGRHGNICRRWTGKSINHTPEESPIKLKKEDECAVYYVYYK